MANSSVDMTRGSVFRHVIAFTFPLLIGNLFQQFYNLVKERSEEHTSELQSPR